MTGLGTDGYTLTVKTTAADDPLAKQLCLGKVSKKVDICATPVKINGVNLESSGHDNVTYHYGFLTITPKISGGTCTYKMTRKTNWVVGSGVVTMGTHKAGDVDADVGVEYPDAQTIVEVTVEGTGFVNSCEGKAYKAITVYDQPGKKVLLINPVL